MKGITVKLSDTTLQRLREEARASGRTVAAILRERIEATPAETSGSMYDLTSDLAGSLSGSGSPASNDRRKFRRS